MKYKEWLCEWLEYYVKPMGFKYYYLSESYIKRGLLR